MSDEHQSDVLSALPRRRPHRRSDKRGARPANPSAQAADHAPPVDASAEGTAATGPEQMSPEPIAASTGPAEETSPEPTVKAARGRAGKPSAARRAKPAPKPTTTTAGASKDAPRPPRLRQPAQPEGTPTSPRRRRPAPPSGTDVLGTAVQAAAELAEIGLSASARALRRAVSKLPRP